MSIFRKSEKILYWMGYIVLGSLSIIFVLYPSIDLYVSHYFYIPREGFYLKNAWIVKILYQSVEIISYILIITIPMALLFIGTQKKRQSLIRPKALYYILAVFIFGSGFIVNFGLKEHCGRARPRQIIEFGGDKKFTPPVIPANQCQHNCSFSCGHCSFAWGFLTFYFLFRHRLVLFLSLLYGVSVSVGRIIQGGHFVSDAFYSALIMFLVAKFFYFLFFKKVHP